MGNRLTRDGCIRLNDEDTDAGKAIMHPPSFNRSAPVQWFADIEDYFEEFHICTDAAKCEVLIEELDWDILQLIDYVQLCGTLNSSSDQRYETLKGIVLHTLSSKR